MGQIRHLHKHKKIRNKRASGRLFFLCAAVLFFCFSLGNRIASAASPTPNPSAVVIIATTTAIDDSAARDAETQVLKDKISQKNSDLEDLKKQIDTYEKQLNFTQQQTKTLQGAVKVLDLSRQKMSTSIQLTQKQLENSVLNINEISLGIDDAQSRINVENKAISEVIRSMDRADATTMLETVLANGKLSDVLDQSMQLTKLRDEADNHIKNLSEYKQKLLAQQTKEESEKKKLDSYKAKLTDQKSLLDSAKKEKSELLNLTKNQESDYQKILNTNKAKAEALDKELFDYESKLTRQLDRKFIPALGSKILGWPVDNVIITQHFGKTKDSVRLYASGTHNGVDFSANRGTPVKSPANGQIVAVGDTDQTCPKASYGKWVLIKHDNGLTSLLGHFDVIKVTPGQSLSAGDLVGYSGNTGYTTGPHVHLTVFASDGVQVGSFASKTCPGKIFTMPLPTAQNAYLDPEAYLPSH